MDLERDARRWHFAHARPDSETGAFVELRRVQVERDWELWRTTAGAGEGARRLEARGGAAQASILPHMRQRFESCP